MNYLQTMEKNLLKIGRPRPWVARTTSASLDGSWGNTNYRQISTASPDFPGLIHVARPVWRSWRRSGDWLTTDHLHETRCNWPCLWENSAFDLFLCGHGVAGTKDRSINHRHTSNYRSEGRMAGFDRDWRRWWCLMGFHPVGSNMVQAFQNNQGSSSIQLVVIRG